MTRLSDTALAGLPESVRRPSYDRATLRTGIVHLGLGAFHRAHQAVYTEHVLGADPAWGITGVSLRSPETRDALAPQDGLFTVAVRDGSGDRFEVIGAIRASLVAPEDPAAVLAAMTAPETRIVSLTVTEKGYCHRPATGELDETHPDIVHDLAHPEAPRSAVGFLVEALARRHAAGVPPFTVLSCDNLPSNGRTVRRVVTRFAALRGPDLGEFVEREVAFPSTMVDRIVPATTDADRALVEAALGVEDRWPVMGEPFSQWVIEDHFTAGRPDWGAAGATFVAEVEPFELMKLRLLNGSHSTLAYLGYLAGHETVADAMGAPGFGELLAGMMEEEVSPTLPVLPGFDLAAYRAELLQRFRNPALRHRTWQIAMDGSQKVPQRLLGTIRDRLAAGQSFDRLALGLAAWMVYATGEGEGGQAIDVRDPLASAIASATAGRRTADGLLEAYLGMAEVFGADLPASGPFRQAVRAALERVLSEGAAKVAASFATTSA
ncbi:MULTISPECIES: mannitol dehydrogenase family protein [unclassified Aureimonas]|uniref:mannitol dehydrogenase family protein n=1 Tax=unclassified Aureimonas TaxID=2615206 RepID=UPI000700525C|nr:MULTISPECIES: mannitol dehydrogenase family protein [unclassified Aureimonas]KQT64031.1 mannitol dehydrogenase [Aureimonas sp. Leaf427]KQT81224.1 mannitol dehydrogenase [Aureimonas sp. Leaf460]